MRERKLFPLDGISLYPPSLLKTLLSRARTTMHYNRVVYTRFSPSLDISVDCDESTGWPLCRTCLPIAPSVRRLLEKGEKQLKDADINDDGVLAFGSVYVLKRIPRRMKTKIV